jgi:hypothetical protein
MKYSPDYRGVPVAEALADFKHRICKYEEVRKYKEGHKMHLGTDALRADCARLRMSSTCQTTRLHGFPCFAHLGMLGT